jgi:DNA polymerase elongation subunit (family B)
MKYLYENGYDIGPLFPDLIDYYESLEKECRTKADIEYKNEDYKDLKKQVYFFRQSVFYKLYKFFNKGPDVRLMKFKEDWVADKGLYYNKHKRYAIHLVREGGKKKDELLFRGIQVRRSDSPKIAKDELSNILNILLASKEKITVQDIFDYIDKVEDKFYDMCKNNSMALGKPVKYGKADHQYKKRPFQVEAMMFWNALHKRNDFTVGSKGYYFMVQYINYDEVMKRFGLTEVEIQNIKETYQTKAIAIPQDVIKVPDYIEIDANETVEKVFVTPYSNILEPIMQETVVSDIPLIDFL